MSAAETTVIAEEVFSIADLVMYQLGAVISREVLHKDTGTVTVFAFDEGQGLSEHTAPFDAFVQVLDGTVRIDISGAAHTLRTGDMIIMPAGKPHALTALTRMKMMLVLVKS